MAVLGCTRYAHRSNSNNTVAANLPTNDPAVRVGATETNVWSGKSGGTVSSNSLNKVAKVLVGDQDNQALLIEGLRTRTRAWHDANGYHRKATVTVMRVTHYAAGPPPSYRFRPVKT